MHHWEVTQEYLTASSNWSNASSSQWPHMLRSACEVTVSYLWGCMNISPWAHCDLPVRWPLWPSHRELSVTSLWDGLCDPHTVSSLWPHCEMVFVTLISVSSLWPHCEMAFVTLISVRYLWPHCEMVFVTLISVSSLWPHCEMVFMTLTAVRYLWPCCETAVWDFCDPFPNDPT